MCAASTLNEWEKIAENFTLIRYTNDAIDGDGGGAAVRYKNVDCSKREVGEWRRRRHTRDLY